MISFINFITSFITKWINTLNVAIFPDMNITYIQLIFGCIVLTFIIKLCFGGFKEAERYSNLSIGHRNFSSSKSMDNSERKKQISDNYIPRHASKE